MCQPGRLHFRRLSCCMAVFRPYRNSIDGHPRRIEQRRIRLGQMIHHSQILDVCVLNSHYASACLAWLSRPHYYDYIWLFPRVRLFRVRWNLSRRQMIGQCSPRPQVASNVLDRSLVGILCYWHEVELQAVQREFQGRRHS